MEDLNLLNYNLLLRLDDLLDKLNINISCKTSNKYFCACPIHLGDNPTAFNIIPDGNEYSGYTWCWSHACMDVFRPTLLGLILGKLSSDSGWLSNGDEIIPFREAIRFAKDFLGGNLQYIPQNKFIRKQTSPYNELAGVRREQVRNALQIPCPYFIKRGYRPELLNSYDIGTCINKMQKMYNRTVVPIYEESGQSLLGVTARSIHSQCDICKMYHDLSARCPIEPWEYVRSSKWIFSRGFRKIDNLFNFNRCKSLLSATGRVILVESVGNVLRLVQNGVTNVVATFGCSLSKEQSLLLQSVKVRKLIVLYDPDEAGIKGAAKILKNYDRTFDVDIINYVGGMDVGDMTDREFVREIRPLLNSR